MFDGADSIDVATQLHDVRSDDRVETARLLFCTGPCKRDKRLWTERETGESHTTQREAISRFIVSLGVGLQRPLRPRDRRLGLLSHRGRWIQE